ncbi:MAG TPA: hypothetical protein PKA88_13270, partial [Polyangiaceae bacterium]|nr:hypothetical protein [Polyangiaceae bacterium]
VCAVCSGTSQLRCGFCGGGGSVAGQRGPKNCPTCRGRGTQKCYECRSGQVDCPSCERAGRVEAWLVLRTSIWHQVRVSSKNASRLHPLVEDAADFDRSPAELPTDLLTDEFVDEGRLETSIRPELDSWMDRLERSRVQNFSADIVHFGYATALGVGVLDVAGKPPTVLSSSNTAPLKFRLIAVAVAACLGAVVAFALMGGYAGRGQWYLLHGSSGVVTLLGVTFVGFTTWAALGLTLARSARTTLRAVVPSAGSALLLLGIALVFAFTGPSLKRAEQALASGDVGRATAEARGLISDNKDVMWAQGVLDEVHLRSVKSQPTVQLTSAAIASSWYSEAKRTAAIAVLEPRAAAEVSTAWKTEDLPALDALAEHLAAPLPAHAARAGGLAKLLRARDCAEKEDLTCASRELVGVSDPSVRSERKIIEGTIVTTAREQLTASVDKAERATDARTRAGRLLASIKIATVVEDLTGRASTPSKKELQSRYSVVERVALREEAVAAAKAKAIAKREEAVENARKRREEAQERAANRANAALRCADGTLSPTCTCGRPRRGCCSHHGGVVGCSAD